MRDIEWWKTIGNIRKTTTKKKNKNTRPILRNYYAVDERYCGFEIREELEWKYKIK